VVSALALAGGVGLVATRSAARTDDDTAPPVPSDAASFGFVVRERCSGIPLLESTRSFTLALANGPVHGGPPDRDRFAERSAFVARELARYPESFLRRIRLAGIVLTEDLAEGETPIPSLPNVGGLLLLDVTSVESDLVHSLHHEIFHFFDLADDGSVAPDPAWAALNAPGFLYGSGGRSLRGAWAAAPTTAITGFVSAYGTSGCEEDKADMFAFAVARPALVRARGASDGVVRAKLAELGRRLARLDATTPHRLGLDALDL
jgi:hypothetical protein